MKCKGNSEISIADMKTKFGIAPEKQQEQPKKSLQTLIAEEKVE